MNSTSHPHDHSQHGQAPAPQAQRDSGPAHSNHEPAAHDRHAGHNVQMFRNRFWIALLLTIPTLVWSEMVQRWFGFTPPAFPGSTYIPAIFGSVVYVYGGWVFLAGAARELRDRLPGMMTLISLAITVAFVFSLFVTFGYQGDPRDVPRIIALQSRQLPKNGGEPLVGGRLQRLRDPASRRRSGATGNHPCSCVRRRADVGKHSQRRHQYPTAATRTTVISRAHLLTTASCRERCPSSSPSRCTYHS